MIISVKVDMGAYNILANWYLENISIDTLIGYRALCNRISYIENVQ